MIRWPVARPATFIGGGSYRKSATTERRISPPESGNPQANYHLLNHTEIFLRKLETRIACQKGKLVFKESGTNAGTTPAKASNCRHVERHDFAGSTRLRSTPRPRARHATRAECSRISSSIAV